MRTVALIAALLTPAVAGAQVPQQSGTIDKAKHAYEVLFTKPLRVSMDGRSC